MKKFYHLVAVNHYPEGYAVLLDGKPVKTQQGRPLLCPTQALAEAMMAEWIAQQEDILPETMPLNQIMITCLDKVDGHRAGLEQEVLGYFDTDLVCYLSTDPPPIYERQQAIWLPLLAELEKSFGISILTSTGLNPLRQNEAAHAAIATYVHNLDDYAFTVLQLITAETGSLLLALVFMINLRDAEQVFQASKIEETYKAEIYREDIHGAAPDVEKRTAQQRQLLQACRQFLDLAKSD